MDVLSFLQCKVDCVHQHKTFVGETKFDLGSSLYNLLNVVLILQYHDAYLGVDLGLELAYVTNTPPFERIVSLDSRWMT